MKSLTCLCLICALNLYFAPKVLRKAKFARGCHDCWNRKKLLQTLKVAQKLTTTIGKGLNNRSLLENLMLRNFENRNGMLLKISVTCGENLLVIYVRASILLCLY